MNDIRTANESNELVFTEAPASWNTRYVDPNGFECQLTLRAETGQELLEKVTGATAYLLEKDCIPYSYRGTYRGNISKNAKDDNSKGDNQSSNHARCPIHQCEMTRWERDGRSWYSHKTDDSWCYGSKERT